MAMKKHHIHDNFIKEWLSDPEIARAFFEEFLPAEIIQHLRLSSLQQLTTSYVTPDLKSKFSDLVWRVETTRGSIHICLLLEHKSYQDPGVVFQMLGYLAEGYLKQWKNQKSVELIIPILYYHGKKQWNLTLLSEFFQGIPPEWQRFIPAYDLIFHDLQKIPVAQIEQLQHGLVKAAMLIQREYAHPDRLREHVARILDSLYPYLDKSGTKSIFVYLVHHLQITYDELVEIEKIIPIENQERMKSLYDHLIERGIERGKEQGIELGKEQGIEQGIHRERISVVLNAHAYGLDLSTIQLITGETLERIQEILKEHKRL